MTIRDEILGHLAKGPAKTSAIADALNLDVSQVSMNCSAMKADGRLTRDDVTKEWALASGKAARPVEAEPEQVSRVRRLPAPDAPTRRQRVVKSEPTVDEKIREALQNQVAWAQTALDAYLEAQGDPVTKTLVDNLIAAKAAQLQYQSGDST